jgi:HK97 family phage major capsid protein
MSADGNRFECAKWQKSTSWKDGLTKAEVRKEEQARKESEERRKAFINFMRTGRVGFEDYLKYGLDGPSNEELLDKEINDAGKTNVHSGEILIPEELEKEIMRALPSLTIMRGICKNQPGMERMKYIDE